MAAKKLGAEFTYDLSELAKVDPNLIHYEERDAIPTGMQEPRGIAIGAEGRLMVAGDRAIRCFDREWKTSAELKVAGEPQRLAFSWRNGAIYVAMTDHVEAYGGNGRLLARWDPAGPKSLLTCVVVAEDDISAARAGVPESDVFVADAAACLVYRYNPAGELIGRIGAEDAAKKIPGILVPSPYFDVAIGPQGTLWVANPGRRRVERYTFDGNLVSAWGKASPKIEGFCGCCNPTHIAVLPDGGLVTSEKGLARVKTYTAQGDLVSVVAPPAAFAEGTVGLDVAADAQGRILVLDPVARKVRVFVKRLAPAESAP
ncbi:MAG: NHL repeat-containing protein [Planctomycetota bacterium]|nr:NHL repeat-containing protein [Planctomycetota bacterium]